MLNLEREPVTVWTLAYEDTTSYTTGLQPAVLSYMLHTVLDPLHPGVVESDEIGLPVSSNGLVLPCGASGRWIAES